MYASCKYSTTAFTVKENVLVSLTSPFDIVAVRITVVSPPPYTGLDTVPLFPITEVVLLDHVIFVPLLPDTGKVKFSFTLEVVSDPLNVTSKLDLSVVTLSVSVIPASGVTMFTTPLSSSEHPANTKNRVDATSKITFLIFSSLYVIYFIVYNI